jgi:hypothetical protein
MTNGGKAEFVTGGEFGLLLKLVGRELEVEECEDVGLVVAIGDDEFGVILVVILNPGGEFWEAVLRREGVGFGEVGVVLVEIA